MSFIELSSVYKKYKMGEVTIPALDGVSFKIEEGELCMIVGPSGAGKTPVLNILGGDGLHRELLRKTCSAECYR